MIRLTDQDIKEINAKVKDSWNEGIFTEPNWIPSDIKEPVIYMRWTKDGYSGGSYNEEDIAEYFERIRPEFTVLDLVLKKVKPNLSYLQYKDVESLIETSTGQEDFYYGNCENYVIEYIVLSKLYKLLEE